MTAEPLGVAVVSGGGSGLGREIALELARRGYALALLGRRQHAAGGDAGPRRASGPGRRSSSPATCATPTALERCAEEIRARWGAAGRGGAGRRGDRPSRRVEETTPDDFAAILATNLTGRLPAPPRPAAGDETARPGLDLPHPLGRRPPRLPGLVRLLRQQVGAAPAWWQPCARSSRARACASPPSIRGPPTRPIWERLPGDWNRAAMVPPREVARALAYALDADPSTLVEEIHLGPGREARCDAGSCCSRSSSRCWPPCPGGKWALPLLAPLTLYPAFRERVRERDYFGAWTLGLAWAFLLERRGDPAASSGCRTRPAAGSSTARPTARRCSAGSPPASAPENDRRAFLPQHLLHLGVFLLLTWASGGYLGLVLGAVLVAYMSYFVGSYAAASGHPFLGSLAAWVPWSVLRVCAFVLLGALFARPAPGAPALAVRARGASADGARAGGDPGRPPDQGALRAGLRPLPAADGAGPVVSSPAGSTSRCRRRR